jgi:hypothetical protein
MFPSPAEIQRLMTILKDRLNKINTIFNFIFISFTPLSNPAKKFHEILNYRSKLVLCCHLFLKLKSRVYLCLI